YAFVEYCYFKNASNPIVSKTESSLDVAAKVFNCEFNGIALVEVGNIKKVTDRTTAVTNQNAFDQTFDTNPSHFYYDATNKCSKVTNLITNLSTIPTEIPKLAGVHKN
ncbi:MAG: hypothetical protein K2N33_01375, partial [Clostridia bacterium]|nr:hypothetical protein [Clostridia bacterium]